jgi:AI-2 transport system permease protein
LPFTPERSRVHIRRRVRLRATRGFVLAAACTVTVSLFQALSPYYLTVPNVATVFRNSIELWSVSLGMSFVLATAGVDIAVGGALGICAILVGWSVQAGWPAPIIFLVGPVVGVMLGLISGALVVGGKVPPIVATLGLFGIYRSTMFLLLGGNWISGLPEFTGGVLSRTIGPFPVSLGYVMVTYLSAALVLHWTPLGIAVLATGGNERAARLAGVAIGRTKAFVYGLTGFLAGLAAVLYVARYRNVETSTGGLVALDAIVAAVLGGASVLGGKANLLGTFLGVLLVRLLQNGFVLIGVPSLWEQVITGALLVTVLAVDAIAARSSGSGKLGAMTYGRATR